MPQGGHNIFKELQCGFNPFLANILILNPPENTRKPKIFCCFEGV